MRQITYLLILTLFIFTACSKSNNDLVIDDVAPSYKIEKLTFFQSETDQVDSVFTRLDTTIHINNTDQYQPDFTYAPYDPLLDSLTILPDDSVMKNIKITEGIYLPSILIQNDGHHIRDVYYTNADSIFLTSFAQEFTMPVNRRMTATETIHSPTPKTKYVMTGEYFQVKYSVSFKAELTNLVDSSYSVITGKIHGSNVATGFYEGQAAHPTTFIIIAKPVEPKTK